MPSPPIAWTQPNATTWEGRIGGELQFLVQQPFGGTWRITTSLPLPLNTVVAFADVNDAKAACDVIKGAWPTNPTIYSSL